MSGTSVVDGREVVALCRDLGFALVGIADPSPTQWALELRRWLAEGQHGSMDYLVRHLEVRMDPGRLLAGARSAIMVGDLYHARGDPPSPAGSSAAPPRGRIAKYARGRDYHVVIRRRLHRLCDALRERFPESAFRAFVDTAPVLERELAARAGLGWIGKHTLLIHPRHGSFMLLGGVLTSLQITPPQGQRSVPDHCGTCTRCIDACPTQAISPYSVDASRCISYLTIERRGPIDPAFFESIGSWVFGCDICQDVCPHNRRPTGSPQGGSEGGREVLPEYAPRRDSFDLLEVLGWTEERRRRELEGTALKRATLAMFKRNALVAAAHELSRRADSALEARVREIAEDESESDLVRRTAREVAARIPARRG